MAAWLRGAIFKIPPAHQPRAKAEHETNSYPGCLYLHSDSFFTASIASIYITASTIQEIPPPIKSIPLPWPLTRIIIITIIEMIRKISENTPLSTQAKVLY